TLTGAVLHQATTIGITNALTMTTLQKIVLTASVAFAVGTGVYEARQISLLRTQEETLRQQQEPFARQAEELHRQRDEALKRLAAADQENARLRRETAEIPQLRGEVTALRQTHEGAIAESPHWPGRPGSLCSNRGLTKCPISEFKRWISLRTK